MPSYDLPLRFEKGFFGDLNKPYQANKCSFDKLLKSLIMEQNNGSPNAVKERKVKGKVEIDIQRCKGCELCTTACKEHALTLSDTINIKGYRYILANNDVCTGCVNCALVCPDAVITVYRTHPKKKAVDITPTDIREQLQTILSTPK